MTSRTAVGTLTPVIFALVILATDVNAATIDAPAAQVQTASPSLLSTTDGDVGEIASISQTSAAAEPPASNSAPISPLAPAPPVAPAPPATPAAWPTVALLLGAAVCGLIIWRWRVLSPAPAATPAGADAPGRSVLPGAPEGSDSLRLKLDAGMLVASGLFVWISQAIGAVAAQLLFRLSEADAQTTFGIAARSAGAYIAAGLAAGFCLFAIPGMARRIGAAPSLRAAAYGVGAFALIIPIVLSVSSMSAWVAYWYSIVTDAPAPSHIAHDTLRTLTEPGGASSVVWWVAVAGVVVGAPIIEEFVYRGCLQSAMDRALRAAGRAPGWWPALLTSAIFTVAHLGVAEPRALLTLFALSVAFGGAYQKSGRLIAPVVIHSLFNAGNIVLAS